MERAMTSIDEKNKFTEINLSDGTSLEQISIVASLQTDVSLDSPLKKKGDKKTPEVYETDGAVIPFDNTSGY